MNDFLKKVGVVSAGLGMVAATALPAFASEIRDGSSGSSDAPTNQAPAKKKPQGRKQIMTPLGIDDETTDGFVPAKGPSTVRDEQTGQPVVINGQVQTVNADLYEGTYTKYYNMIFSQLFGSIHITDFVSPVGFSDAIIAKQWPGTDARAPGLEVAGLVFQAGSLALGVWNAINYGSYVSGVVSAMKDANRNTARYNEIAASGAFRTSIDITNTNNTSSWANAISSSTSLVDLINRINNINNNNNNNINNTTVPITISPSSDASDVLNQRTSNLASLAAEKALNRRAVGAAVAFETASRLVAGAPVTLVVPTRETLASRAPTLGTQLTLVMRG